MTGNQHSDRFYRVINWIGRIQCAGWMTSILRGLIYYSIIEGHFKSSGPISTVTDFVSTVVFAEALVTLCLLIMAGLVRTYHEERESPFVTHIRELIGCTVLFQILAILVPLFFAASVLRKKHYQEHLLIYECFLSPDVCHSGGTRDYGYVKEK